jgi:hypothetical protein
MKILKKDNEDSERVSHGAVTGLSRGCHGAVTGLSRGCHGAVMEREAQWGRSQLP